MLWFWVIIIAAVLLSISNHIDRYLMSKIFNHIGIGALIIFSTISAIPASVIFWWVEPNILNISASHAIMLIIAGIIYSVAIIAYLYAMRADEATNVVPLFQIIPVFSFIFGYIFLGETLGLLQLIGSLCILIGGIAITLRYDGARGVEFRGSTFLLMLFASIVFAAMGVLFKFAAIEENFWVANFWENIGMSICAVVLLICTPTYRAELMAVLRKDSKRIIGLNVLNESLAIISLLMINYAILLVPVALVSIASSTQPLIVLLLGVGITIYFPSITQETITKRDLGRKLFAIVLVILGAYLINQ